MTKSMGSVAVFVAHPDDEVLGAGGTIARLSADHEVHVVMLGEGITARKEAQKDRSTVDALYEDARTVASMLGVASLSFESLPDIRFDTVPLLDIVWRVEERIRTLRPSTVYTHHPGDLNIDHQTTFRAVLTATRPVSGCPVRALYTFEVASSTEWAFSMTGPPFQPNVFVDIAATIEQKVEAMERYRSERRPPPHPRSPDSLRAIARRWGSTVGCDYAEAFQLIRQIG